jgi:hypothetical protein
MKWLAKFLVAAYLFFPRAKRLSVVSFDMRHQKGVAIRNESYLTPSLQI